MLNYIDLLKICRTCVTEREEQLPLTAIVDENNLTITDYFKKYLQLDHNENDKTMPQNICFICFDRLLEVRKFFLQSRESERYFKLKLSINENIPNVNYQFEILQEKNNSFKTFENLDENDYLEFENNDQNFAVEFTNSLDEKIEYLDEKLQEFEKSVNYTQNTQFMKINSEEFSLEELHDKYETINISIYSVGCDAENDSVELLNRCKDEEKNNAQYADNSQKSSTNDNENLSNSSKQIFKNSSLVCPNCGKHYPTKLKMNQHLRTHNKIEYICKKCGKIYHNRQCFKEHEFAHKGIKPYKCEYCGKEFGHESVKRAHVKLHTGKNIKCMLCDKTFVAQSHLRIHMTYHTNNLRFACDLCPKRYRKNNLLQMHLKTHTNKRTETCKYCGSDFYTKDDLRHHMNDVHLKRYHCNLCNKRYGDPGRLRDHFFKHHSIEVVDLSAFKKNVDELDIIMIKPKNQKLHKEI